MKHLAHQSVSIQSERSEREGGQLAHTKTLTAIDELIDGSRPLGDRFDEFQYGGAMANDMDDFATVCEDSLRKICDRHFATVNRLLSQLHSVEQQADAFKTDLDNKKPPTTTANNGDAGFQEWASQGQATGISKKGVGFAVENPSDRESSTFLTPRTSSAQVSSSVESQMYGQSSTLTGVEPLFELWPMWTKREKEFSEALTNKGNQPGKTGMQVANKDVAYDTEVCRNYVMKSEFASSNAHSHSHLDDHTTSCSRFFRRLMLPPNHRLRLGFWDPWSFLLVSIECIYIPLQFFPLEEGAFQIWLSWISRLFWTADLPMSFFTGYQTADGAVVKTPILVAKKYVKSWFILDVSLITLDWMEMFLGSLNDNLSAARMGKTMKSLRMLRMLRIARIVKTIKLPEWLSSLVYFVKSDTWKIGSSIFRIVLFLVIINHFLACIWYSIAKGHADPNWISVHSIDARSLLYQYMTSYHWALTQFGGSMEINPVNADERSFTCAVGIAAFFGGAIIISSITTQMTHWEIIGSGQSARVTMLQDFLVDRQVSRVLTMKIVKSAQLALEEIKKNTTEQRVELLAIIPEPMKLELHHSLYMSSLEVHPFFSRLNILGHRTMQGVCHTTLSRTSFVAGSIIFADGEVTANPEMYFVVSGQVVFVKGHKLCTPLSYPKFLCEAALWTPWFHQGTLVAKQDSALLAVSVEKFQEVVNTAPKHDYNVCLRYGRAFLKALNKISEDELTDLYDANLFDAEKWMDDNYPLADAVDAHARRGLWLTKTLRETAIGGWSRTTKFGGSQSWCNWCCSRRR